MKRARVRSVYCTREQWAAIAERAARAGMPVSRFVVACALGDAHAAQTGRQGRLFDHRLALSEREQRILYKRIGSLERRIGALFERLPGAQVSLVEALSLIRATPGGGGAAPTPVRAAAGAAMTRTGRTAAATHAISCTEAQWERIRTRAARAGVSISAYVVERARGAAPASEGVGAAPRLVLDEAEQRTLHARIERVSELALGAGSPGEGALADLLGAAEALLDQALLRVHGEDRDVRAVLAERFGEARGARIAARFEARRKAGALLD